MSGSCTGTNRPTTSTPNTDGESSEDNTKQIWTTETLKSKGNRKAGGVHHPPKEKKLAFSRNSTSQVTEQSYFRFLIGIHRIEIARKFVQVQQ